MDMMFIPFKSDSTCENGDTFLTEKRVKQLNYQNLDPFSMIDEICL